MRVSHRTSAAAVLALATMLAGHPRLTPGEGQGDEALGSIPWSGVQPAMALFPPVALPDVGATPIDTVLTVNAPGVLANDSDLDGDPLTAVLLSPPTIGAVILAPNGGYTYSPPPNWAGIDVFRYCANDATTCSLPTTVTITVIGVPKPSLPPLPSPIATPTPPPPSPTPTPTPTASGSGPSLPPASTGPSPTPSSEPASSDDPSPGSSPSGGGGAGGGGGSPEGSVPPIRIAPADIGDVDMDLGGGSGFGPLVQWAVPAAVLTIPGLLALIVAIAQALGGMAWLPIVRRSLRGTGPTRSRRYRYVIQAAR